MTSTLADSDRIRAFARADAERRLGRALTRGELAIDIVQADRDLAEGKARLAAAIEKEKRRAVRAALNGLVGRMGLTREMILALRWLYGRGRDHALAEMGQLGVRPRQRKFYAARRSYFPYRLTFYTDKTRSLLGGIQLRLHNEVEGAIAENGGVFAGLIASEVERQIPGALDAASRLVSGSFASGLADVYEEHADLFSGWQYTAVMDEATCDVCESYDGEEFGTLEEMYSVLPDFGPNPECLGEDRCRCRGVPLGPSE